MKTLLICFLTLTANAADLQLKATPATVAWGYYWSAAKPV
ncbi:MAG: Acetamidase/Formamidase, partial [Candidatus Solibacter sp.]|nr:Acetamidase/Formamidase [Candidatus Solibacter sp.]